MYRDGQYMIDFILLSLSSVAEHTMTKSISVKNVVSTPIPTNFGEFILSLFTNTQDDKEHLAFIKGEVGNQENVLVRVHSECFTGDVLGSQRCDCGEQLETSLELIANEGTGAIIYMRQEGRGIGLEDKLRAYNLQDQGYDTVDANLLLGHQADNRNYSITAEILKSLSIKSIRLLTNNPAKIESLKKLGIQVNARIKLAPTINPDNISYIRTKIQRMHHILDLPTISASQHNGSY